jgi:hypothetical protein
MLYSYNRSREDSGRERLSMENAAQYFVLRLGSVSSRSFSTDMLQ